MSKYVSNGHENDPRGHTSGVISAGSGDRIRTCDLWVMSPASYRAAPPRVGEHNLTGWGDGLQIGPLPSEMAGLPTMTTHEVPGARIEVGSEAGELDARLSRELTRFNVAATGCDDERELTVTVLDEEGELIAGLSGWTWGTAAGIGMVWVHDDHRRASWGGRLLRAAEEEAR